MTPFFRIVCVALVLATGTASLHAEGLKSAQVSRIFNDVKLLPENQPPRPATVTDTVSGKAAVQTGAASRSELMFSDKTLTRLGANSFFSFVNGTRDMNLGSGTMLLQVPKGAGGAEIHTAAVTAAITGTTLMVEFNPKSYSKIIVLEGTVRAFLTRRLGESVLVHAGQMVIVPPGAVSMPEPVSVDLKVLYATSGLINDFGPLASERLIDHEITRQRRDIDGGKLADTNLFIVGRGTQVQEGHLTFVSGNDHSVTARQGAHTPLGVNETARPTPVQPTPPPVTPTAPPRTPTPPPVTPTVPPRTPTPPPTAPPVTPTVPPTTPTPTPATPTPTPATPTPTPPVTPTPPPATPTPTPVPTATPPPTPTPTPVPTATPPPTPTATPTVTPSPTVTPTPTVSPSPTVTPTPSPSPSVSPTPSPSPTITPTPPPTPSKFGPLPLIANNGGGNGTAYAIDGTSAIRTDPFITTQDVTDAGRIYRGGTVANPVTAGSVDGLPSFYFLGATAGPSTFDAQVGFDQQVGTLGQVGGFKFGTLVLLGNPASISTADGPTSLVFVAVNGITDFNQTGEGLKARPGVPQVQGPAGNTFDLRGLDNVLFVTQSGGIVINNGLTFTNAGTTATALTLYARGGGLDLNTAAFTLPGSALNFYSDTEISDSASVGSATTAGAGAVNLISGGRLTIDGLIHSTGDIVARTVDADSLLYIGNGTPIQSDGGDFNATSAGSLTSAGVLTTGGSTRLLAGTGLDVLGNITAGANIRLKTDAGDLSTDISTLLQAPGTFTAIATAGNLTLRGTVGANGNNPTAQTPTTATVTGGLDVTLGGDLAATDSVAVQSTGGGVTQSGGVVRALGVTPGSTPTPGTVTVTTANGNILFDGGTLSGRTVTVTTTGGNVTQNETHTLQTNGGGTGTVTSANGAVRIDGTANVGSGELDLTAGTTLDIDGASSLVEGNTVHLTAGTTATFDLAKINAGTVGASGTLTVNAATIDGTNATARQDFTTFNLTSTGATTLDGFFNVTTLKAGGDLTLRPNSTVSVANLNTTGATGALAVGDGVAFTLDAGTNPNAVGPVTLDGSPLLKLFGSLTVTGAVSATGTTQGSTVDLGPNAKLTATGNVGLGAGQLLGAAGSTLGTNGTVTTTGSVSVDTLNAFGGVNVGALAVRTLTLQNLGGATAANPPGTVVTGSITPYAPGGMHTFTVGSLTAGSLDFAGTTTPGGSLDAASLTLNVRGNFGVGAGGGAGSVGSADFRGSQRGVTTGGLVAGNGGAFAVTTTGNAVTGAPGAINIPAGSTTFPPLVSSAGGTLSPTNNGVPGTGGKGGSVTLQAADALSVGNGATVSAAGGNFQLTSFATYAGGGANGGVGGTVGLTAGTTLTLTGGTGNPGDADGPVVVTAQGGSAIRSTDGTGGAGGAVTLQGGTAVNLANAQVNASGGDVPVGTTVGDAKGGTITITSVGTATPTATSVSLAGSTLNASNGVGASVTQATGTGGTITILSQDGTVATGLLNRVPAATGPGGSPTPPAVFVSNSTLVASQEEAYPQALSTASPTPTPTPAYASKTGGTVNVTSQRTSGPGISVQDASSLLALVDSRGGGAGGHVNLTTGGADIAVTGGSTVRASGAGSTVTITTGTTGSGTINVANSVVNTLGANGTFATGGTVSLSAGAINLSGSTVSADLLKMQAFGANGSIVIDSGSVLSAATQLKLYATGTNGSITFQGGNITLNSGTLGAVLAAHSVTVASNTVVAVNGGLQVYTTLVNANYSAASGGNGNTTGLFENGSTGAPLDATPQTGTPPAYNAAAAHPNAKPANPAVPLIVGRPARLPGIGASFTGNRAGRPTAGVEASSMGNRSGLPGRLLRQGNVTLLVEPVAPSKAAAALQNQVVLQSLAVPTNRPVAAERNRAVQRDRPKRENPVTRPMKNVGLQR